jgi:hypothetical protein
MENKVGKWKQSWEMETKLATPLEVPIFMGRFV